MPSLAGGLGIIAIGVAIGLTAGFALPAAGLIAGTTMLGGLAFSSTAALIAGGFGVAGAAQFLFNDTIPADDMSGSARRTKANISDAEMPRAIFYGWRGGLGWSRAWQGLAGSRDDFDLLEGVISDSITEEVIGITIDDVFAPIAEDRTPNTFVRRGSYAASGTNPIKVYKCIQAGTTSSGSGPNSTAADITDGTAHWAYQPEGGLVRNLGGRLEQSDTLSSHEWFVPTALYQAAPGTGVVGKNHVWRARDQLKKSGSSNDPLGPQAVWHVALIVERGTQTQPSASMALAAGAQWKNRRRVYRGLTVFHLMLRANTDLGFGSGIPEVLFEMRGKPVYDPRVSGEVWTRNPILIAVDYCKWRLGFTNANFDMTNVAEMATACETALGGTQPADEHWYAFDDTLRWDEDPEEVLNVILKHCHGGWWEHGDRILFWVGTYRAADKVMTLTTADVIGDVTYQRRLPSDEQANRVVVHYITPDGWEPTPHTGQPDLNHAVHNQYLEEDNGITLPAEMRLRGCTNVHRAHLMAWFELNQRRLQGRYTATFKMRALECAPGDIVGLIDPLVTPEEELFWVEQQALGFRGGGVTMTLRSYQDAIYTVNSVIDEDVLDNPPAIWLGQVPQVASGSIFILTIDGSGNVQPDGTLRADVEISWEEVAARMIGGDYVVEWRRFGTTEWQSLRTGGLATHARVTSLLVGAIYEFQVAARVMANNRINQGPFSDIVLFTVTSGYLPLPTAASDTAQAGNLVSDPDFDRSAGLETSPYWQHDRVAGEIGTVTFSEVGGKVSAPSAIIYSGLAGGTGSQQTMHERVPHPSQPGEFFRIGVWVIAVAPVGTAPRYDLVFNVRDVNRTVLVDAAINRGEVYDDIEVWRRREEIVQAPHGSWSKLDGALEGNETTSGTGLTALFPTVQPLAINRRGIAYVAWNGAATIETDPSGAVQTPGTTAFSPDFSSAFGADEGPAAWLFQGRDTDTTGDDIAIFAYTAPALTGYPITGGQITQNAGNAWAVVAGALGGEINDPITAPTFQQKGAATVQTNPATPLQPVYPTTGLQEGDTWHAIVAVHADSGRSATAPSGWFLEGSQHNEDLMIRVFGKPADGTETAGSPPSFTWTGTGGNVVAMAVIYRWRGCLGEVAYAELQLRADYDTVNGQPSTFRFDGALIERIAEVPAVVNGAFIGFFNSLGAAVSSNRRVIAETAYWYPPPTGYVFELETSFRYQMERIAANSNVGTLEVWIQRIRESDGAVSTLYGTDDTTGVTIDRYHGGAVSEDRYGTFRLRVQDGVSPDDGNTRQDRFKHRVLARMKSSGSPDASFRWGALQRNLKLRLTLVAFATESGGGTE
jgi:hypothetical protein